MRLEITENPDLISLNNALVAIVLLSSIFPIYYKLIYLDFAYIILPSVVLHNVVGTIQGVVLRSFLDMKQF